MSTGDTKPAKSSGSTPEKNRNKNKFYGKRPTTTIAPSYKGKCAELGSHVYDCSDSRSSDQYSKTTKEIADYIGRTNSHGGAGARIAILNGQISAMAKPIKPTGSDETDLEIWKSQIKRYVNQETQVEEILASAYAIIWGQCTLAMQAKVKGLPGYETFSQASNSLALLEGIKTISYNFQSQKFPPHAIHEAQRKLYLFFQPQLMDTHTYFEKFNSLVDVVKAVGGALPRPPGVLAMAVNEADPSIVDRDNMSDAEFLRAAKVAEDMNLAMMFLLSADRHRFGKLIVDLENDYTQGSDKYPRDIGTAYNMLVYYKSDTNKSLSRYINADGVAFQQDGETMATEGRQRRDVKHITCFNCDKKGHYATDCPEPKRKKKSEDADEEDAIEQTGITQLTMGDFDDIEDLYEGFGFHVSGSAEESLMSRNDTGTVMCNATISDAVCNYAAQSKIPTTWLLLDNQSNVDIFCNAALLKNIHEVAGSMRINTNNGSSVTKLMGTLPGYGEVWFDPRGIANIISLSHAKEMFRITYDSAGDDVFVVHKEDGTTREFRTGPMGLYYHDVKKQVKKGHVAFNMMGTKERCHQARVTLTVVTVDDKKASYTNRDVAAAQEARKLQAMVGRPSTRDFIKMVQHNLLPNCPVTVDDIKAAEDIYGPDLGSLKGKTVRTAGTHVPASTTPLPITIVDRYRVVALCVDIMKINRIPFFMSISRNIKFGTAEIMPSMVTRSIIKCIQSIVKTYYQRGFRVRLVLGDGQFEPIRGDLAGLGANLNICGANEHVPEVERFIRTVKERVRSLYNSLPFDMYPHIMLKKMVYFSVFWLNMMPPSDGVSKTISPRTIVTGLSANFLAHCWYEFGGYAQTHEEHDNTMLTRTIGAICLGPSGNIQGGYHFMNLATGMQLTRTHWTALPMPREAIDQVHAIARQNKADRTLTFTRHDNAPIDDGSDDEESDEDSDYNPDEDSDRDDPDDGPTPTLDDANEENGPDDEQDVFPAAADLLDVQYGPPDHPEDEEDMGEDTPDIPEAVAGIAEIVGVPEVEGPAYEAAAPDIEEEPPALMLRRSTRERRQPSRLIETHMLNIYGQKSVSLFEVGDEANVINPLQDPIETQGIAMTQYNIKKGLQVFGDEGVKAVQDELEQLVDMDVMTPRSDMTHEEKRSVLQYLMFLKQKRCGRIKGRGCADGRKQQAFTDKADASSPTVALESLFLSCIMDAKEGRDVATVDVPGAFMQADMDETVFIRFDGTMAELLAKLNPSMYRKHIQIEGKKKVLYAELKKALYGTLRAALLFWQNLSAFLESLGFEKNPYDLCVANKTVDGEQCTVLWHVDDLKISHKDPDVVSSLIETLEDKYGEHKPLSVTRGDVHDYLGMTIDYSLPGKVKITMFDYIEKMLEEMPPIMDGESATPAAGHLFEVDQKAEPLSEEDSVFFHYVTAKLLFLCKRARPDMQTAVAFLSTRVRGPDKDDYKKLTRAMKYLRGTRTLPLILQADDALVIKWYIDASYAVHPDMRGHTGGAMTLGKGVPYANSSKHKLNAKSSTEAEVIGMSDMIGQALWTRYFLEAQGYQIQENRLYQDNKSAMLLERNGRASSGKKTRHINIRYFFVQDRIASGEVTLEHCPTEMMIGDFFTKPLQGAAFVKFRDAIMNHNN